MSESTFQEICLPSPKPEFIGSFNADELRILECVFDTVWLRITSAGFVRPQSEEAQLQRMVSP